MGVIWLRSHSSLCSQGTALSFTNLVPDALLHESSQQSLGPELLSPHGLGVSPPAVESQN